MTATISSGSRPSSVALHGELVRAQRELVHVRAGDLELLADLVGLFAHVLAGERVGEPVVHHRVERLRVAHPVAEASLLEQVGSARHRLHAARHGQVEVAGAHCLVDDPGRAQPGRADLVDGLAGDLLRDSGLDLRLSARDLALPGLEHLSEHDVLDLLGRDLGTLECGCQSPFRRARWRRATRGRLPSFRTACGRHRGSRSWASELRLLASCGAATISPGYAPAPMPGPTVTASSGRARGDRGRHPRRRPVRGRDARRPGAAGARRARRGQARAQEGRRRARGRAGRGPAPGPDRRDSASATSSTPSALALRPPPRPGVPRSSARCRSHGPHRPGPAWPQRSWRARSSSCTRSTASSRRRRTTAPGWRRSRSGATASTPARSSGRGSRPARPTPPATSRTSPPTSPRPLFLAERAAEIAAQHDALEVELLDREAIAARGMGAFAAVAQGTEAEPRLIVLRWRPPGAERTAPRLRRARP